MYFEALLTMTCTVEPKHNEHAERSTLVPQEHICQHMNWKCHVLEFTLNF